MRTPTSNRLALPGLGSILWVVCSLGLCGCAYLEAQPQRTAEPNDRIQLGWQDRLSVHPRDIGNYTCAQGYLLQCDRAGSVTYSCTCSLR